MIQKQDTYKFWGYMTKKYPKLYKITWSLHEWILYQYGSEPALMVGYCRNGWIEINPITCRTI